MPSDAPASRPRPRCPICSRPSDPVHRPFCSDRCKQVDLGRWLKGAYAIPGQPVEEEEPEGQD
jgi:endogenous inhibitor of DNA gyrase (YacG/DUF329 family)